MDKSAVAEHDINEGHCINFKDTMVLARTASYMDFLVKEAIEIQLHLNNFYRHGLFLN
jgi:hypothetical protein